MASKLKVSLYIQHNIKTRISSGENIVSPKNAISHWLSIESHIYHVTLNYWSGQNQFSAQFSFQISANVNDEKYWL